MAQQYMLPWRCSYPQSPRSNISQHLPQTDSQWWYLNFRSNHRIEHRGNCLISNEGDNKLETKHIYQALSFNGYPARFLNEKLNKAKLEVKKVNQQQSQTEVRSLTILSYIPELSE